MRIDFVRPRVRAFDSLVLAHFLFHGAGPGLAPVRNARGDSLRKSVSFALCVCVALRAKRGGGGALRGR